MEMLFLLLYRSWEREKWGSFGENRVVLVRKRIALSYSILLSVFIFCCDIQVTKCRVQPFKNTPNTSP